MSTKEQLIYSTVEAFRSGKLSRKEAALILEVSEKTISRKAKAIRKLGMIGVKHGNRGNIPVNKKPSDLEGVIIDLIRRKFYDFNISHAREMLAKEHDIKISYATLYKWCRLAGLCKYKKTRRPSKVRVLRERVANEGLMQQMDGSHHKWNGKDTWCLIALIDDATSDIPFAQFSPTETTIACMNVLRKVIEQKGIPDIIYTDHAGWSGNGKRTDFSQFKRACEELGIRIISTSSPESKGRIERAWRTFQSRLIPELRHHEVKSMTGANQYLQQSFLPLYWRQRNTVHPRSERSRYKPVPSHIDLDKVFCLKYERQVYSNHTVSFEGRTIRITESKYGSLKGKTITINQYQSGQIDLFHGHLKIQFDEVNHAKRAWIAKPA